MRFKLHSRDYEFLQKWCDEHDKYCWMKTNKHGDEKIETHGYENRKKYLEESGIIRKKDNE
jgi:hypothetical protein